MPFCQWCQLESETDDKCVWCKRAFGPRISSSGSGRNDLYYLQERDAEVDRTPLIGGIMGALFIGVLIYAFVAYGNGPKKDVVASNATTENFSGKRPEGMKDVYAERFQSSRPAASSAPARTVSNNPRPQQQHNPVQPVAQVRPSTNPGQSESFPSPTRSAADPTVKDDTAGYLESASVNLVRDGDQTSCVGSVTVVNAAGQHLKFKLFLVIDGVRYELAPFKGKANNPQFMNSFELNVGQGESVGVIARNLQEHTNIQRMSVFLESYGEDRKMTGGDELVIK